jgi:hypothetical protein
MATFIFGLRIAASIGHEPGGIDHAQIRRADFVRQPLGAYYQFHVFVLARYF